jgi:hypothetical protein
VNAELLAASHPLVREDYERMLAINGALERALELAVRDLKNRREPEDMPGTPPGDEGEAREWMDYYIGRGWLVYHEELELSGGLTPDPADEPATAERLESA